MVSDRVKNAESTLQGLGMRDPSPGWRNTANFVLAMNANAAKLNAMARHPAIVAVDKASIVFTWRMLRGMLPGTMSTWPSSLN